VSAKELAFWHKEGIDLSSVGIFFDENNYYRYDFYRVESLDRITRQQGHILDSYLFLHGFQSVDELMQFVTSPRTKKLTGKIVDRQQALDKLLFQAQRSLKSWRTSLLSIFDNSPAFNNSFPLPQETKVVCNFLKCCASRCRDPKFRFKPFGRKLRYASNNLLKAAFYLKNDEFKKAKGSLIRAIKHIDYLIDYKTS
jgi:hypothetical protein